MATFRKITVCALNVVIHDKDKRSYEDLLQASLRLRHAISFNNTHAALIVGLRKYQYGDDLFIVGEIIKYVNIKPPYFDASKYKILYDEDVNHVQMLPPNIKGTANTVYFALDLSTHRIYVDNRFITAKSARSFFAEIFAHGELVKKFGLVDVSIHSESKTAEVIANFKTLKKIDVRIMRPNPIGVNRYDELVLNKLKEQNADNLSISISSNGDFLDPNEEFRAYMYAATSHGTIKAVTIDETNKRKDVSTDEMPMTHSEQISKGEPYHDALCRIAKSLWRKITEDGNRQA